MLGHADDIVISIRCRWRIEAGVDRIGPRVDANDEILLGAHPDGPAADGDVAALDRNVRDLDRRHHRACGVDTADRPVTPVNLASSNAW